MQICTLGGGFLSEANRWTTSRDDAEYSQWLDKSQEKIFGVKSLGLQKKQADELAVKTILHRTYEY